LEKQLDAKQKLEMEIEHLENEDDTSVRKKMEEMNETLQEKVDDLNDMEEMNNVLIAKERSSNDELQEARKQFIAV